MEHLTQDDILSVSIEAGEGSLTATVVGGTEPYSYSWVLCQNSSIVGGGSQVAVSPSAAITAITPSGGGGSGTQGLWRCSVEDNKGVKASAYYLYITPGS